jgi:hypothetical protein
MNRTTNVKKAEAILKKAAGVRQLRATIFGSGRHGYSGQVNNSDGKLIFTLDFIQRPDGEFSLQPRLALWLLKQLKEALPLHERKKPERQARRLSVIA